MFLQNNIIGIIIFYAKHNILRQIMNRREFMRGLALAFAGITLSELLTPVRMAEAAIAI